MEFRKGLLTGLVVISLLLSGCMAPRKEEKPELLGDVVSPSIELLTPTNGSFIKPGNRIQFNISDDALENVECTVDNLPISLRYPWILNTSSWSEGTHRVNIRAWDESNNTAERWYMFSIDLTPPKISLVSPPDGSAIESGTYILLDISDRNPMGANYSLDGGKPQCLPRPFRISTRWWAEGRHVMEIRALDKGMNSNLSTFTFWIDNRNTSIRLISPSGRVMRAGEDIVFSIEDITLKNIAYSINGAGDIPWSSPWVIHTDGWLDGLYSITIKAVDAAGHTVIKTFQIEIDNTPPSLNLSRSGNITVNAYMDEKNYSFWKGEDYLKVNVSDAHLDQVLYSLNGGEFRILEYPYLIDPGVWRGERFNLTLKASDSAGNEAEKAFQFNLSFTLRIYMYGNYSLGNYSDISIPFILEDSGTRDVFECINGTENGTYDKVVSYYGGTRTFVVDRPDKFNNLKEISPSMGLRIRIRSDFANFTVKGILPKNWTIHLKEGSNFVSYPFMQPMRVDRALQGVPWYMVQRWDWQNQRYISMKGDDILLPGYAYWIYVSYDHDWTVDL